MINDQKDPNSTKEAIAKIIQKHSTNHWKDILSDETNICCSIVNNIEEAFNDKQIIERQLLAGKIKLGGKNITVMPTPLAPFWRAKEFIDSAPKLGEGNNIFVKTKWL